MYEAREGKKIHAELYYENRERERERQKRTIVEYRGKMRPVLKLTFGCDDVQ
jgi:hypothetical protein